MDKLNQLIDETWSFHQKLKKDKETKDILVPDSMPLLWLGNFEDYKKSNLKVVTLSKNSSYAEFGENNRFEKMDYLSQLTSLTDKDRDRDIYINQLNDYLSPE
ncbi:MAG: hypothetical protein FWF42_01690 [Streptococcaceae bacterium]|nr:hypothetical protein [Streptococcaceae bacterium]MCL2858381.1 hypothetical protein [Streptococcaceae bacterium]